MKIDTYPLKAGSERTVFEFVSEGPKGAIQKLILFQETAASNFYNLAFGDKDLLTGNLNDLAVSNNDDINKVLTTVVAALYIFFDHYPDAFVYATGSTPARTRLYRRGITRFYKEVQADFYLFGQVGNSFTVFEPDREYDGFLAKRKFD